MLLTCSMIAKNESARLADCLQSIRPHVDELVLVDTGSTDNTMAIAAQYCDIVRPSIKFNATTKLEDFHFAEARNEALSLCSGHWVLSIDADETIEARGHRELLATEAGQCAVVAMRSDVNNHRSTAWVPRLFRRNGRAWIGRYHDTPNPFTDVSRFPESALRITNHGCDQKEKTARNLILLTKQHQEDGKIGYTTLRIADAYLGAGPSHAAEALGYYIAYLEHAEIRDFWRYVSTQVAKCFYHLGLHGTAIEWLHKVTKKYPDCEMPYLLMGACYYRISRFGMAKACWQHLLTIDQEKATWLHPVIDDPIDRQPVYEWIDILERKHGC